MSTPQDSGPDPDNEQALFSQLADINDEAIETQHNQEQQQIARVLEHIEAIDELRNQYVENRLIDWDRKYGFEINDWNRFITRQQALELEERAVQGVLQYDPTGFREAFEVLGWNPQLLGFPTIRDPHYAAHFEIALNAVTYVEIPMTGPTNDPKSRERKGFEYSIETIEGSDSTHRIMCTPCITIDGAPIRRESQQQLSAEEVGTFQFVFDRMYDRISADYLGQIPHVEDGDG